MIYLDHHSTTPLDPAVLEAMLPFLRERFANAGSITHQAGREVAAFVEAAIDRLAQLLGATADEIVVTSGATESNNLALLGSCLHPRQKRRRIISLVTEHKALLDPLARLEKHGFSVTLLPVQRADDVVPGGVCLERLEQEIDDKTALVSVMLANNEIGTIQPINEIASLCRRHGAMLHTDASQALGRLPVDVDQLDVDLMSFSAHKFYGPKGVGGLYVRRRDRRVRVQPQIVGGGQQHNLRSGTLNTVGIIGMSAALDSCLNSLESDSCRIEGLRKRLFDGLQSGVASLALNGPDWRSTNGLDALPPAWDRSVLRLPGNLNCCFFPVEGQSLMLEVPEVAMSSGSACTSAEPTPSHVLLALGLSEDQARSSLRFGIGRFNTETEIDIAAEQLIEACQRLKRLLQ